VSHKYTVKIAWTTIEVQEGTLEIISDVPMTRDEITDHALNCCLTGEPTEPVWGYNEITEGDYDVVSIEGLPEDMG